MEYLREHNLLPAICFVFSRKKTEEYAYQISHSLHDGKTMNIIAKRCKQILMLKLPNYQEYIELPEYLKLVKILVKGIAHHHSGMLPVFKEMIELLFAEGYIKILFATETFAVGINMPAKQFFLLAYKNLTDTIFVIFILMSIPKWLDAQVGVE